MSPGERVLAEVKAAAERENMIRGYTQSIYSSWVGRAGDALVDLTDEELRGALREARRMARIAAEVLFEEEKP